MSLSKQNCAWPSCRCSALTNAAQRFCTLCTGAGLDGFLANRSSSLCFLCPPPPPWTQCTGTSDLQPSLDRARSASTNCLRPDASLHSPERERYTVKTFLLYHFVQSPFFPSLCFVSRSFTGCSSMFTRRLSASPLPPVQVHAETYVYVGEPEGTRTHISCVSLRMA